MIPNLRNRFPACLAGAVALTLAAGAVSLALAAEGGKDIKGDVIKLAGLLEKKDEAEADKLAAATAKKVETEDLMGLFAVRKGKGPGLGVGREAGAIQPDGIERKLGDLAKKELSEKDLADQADALKDLGYQSAAIGAVNHASKMPDVKKGRKADWLAWSNELKETGIDLAEAAAKKEGGALKKAAAKVNATCAKCHEVFKGE